MSDFRPSPTLTQDVGRIIEPNIKEATDRVTAAAKGAAEVLTGELQSSIHGEVMTEGGVPVGYVIADAEHAAFVEYGTVNMGPQPFMRPALSSAGL